MNVHSIKMDKKLEFKCVLFVNVLKYKTKALPFHKYWPQQYKTPFFLDMLLEDLHT